MPRLDGDTQYPGAGVPYGTTVVQHMLGTRLWDRDALVQHVLDTDIRFNRESGFIRGRAREHMNQAIDRMLELGHLHKEGDHIRVLEYQDFPV